MADALPLPDDAPADPAERQAWAEKRMRERKAERALDKSSKLNKEAWAQANDESPPSPPAPELISPVTGLGDESVFGKELTDAQAQRKNAESKTKVAVQAQARQRQGLPPLPGLPAPPQQGNDQLNAKIDKLDAKLEAILKIVTELQGRDNTARLA